MKKIPTLAVVAGHSAGHILPAHTLAQEWLEKHSKSTVLFFSTDKTLDKIVLATADKRITLVRITLPALSLKQWWQIPLWGLKFLQACIQSYRILKKNNVKKLITTGGFIALPLCLAAQIVGIPIELYELNVIPGKAIWLLSFFAQKIYICFAQTQNYFKRTQCTVIQYPLQPSLLKQHSTSQYARTQLGLYSHYITILVLGGSQGSFFINNVIKQWIPFAVKKYKNIQIIHQTGSQDTTDWITFYKQYNVHARFFAYHTAIHELYNAADIILCRSGSGTLFEVLHYKKRCITIPLEGLAGNHQVMNAHALAEQYPHLIHILPQHVLKDDISSYITLFDNLIEKYY